MPAMSFLILFKFRQNTSHAFGGTLSADSPQALPCWLAQPWIPESPPEPSKEPNLSEDYRPQIYFSRQMVTSSLSVSQTYIKV